IYMYLIDIYVIRNGPPGVLGPSTEQAALAPRLAEFSRSPSMVLHSRSAPDDRPTWREHRHCLPRPQVVDILAAPVRQSRGPSAAGDECWPSLAACRRSLALLLREKECVAPGFGHQSD